jgi:hypothetical protein
MARFIAANPAAAYIARQQHGQGPFFEAPDVSSFASVQNPNALNPIALFMANPAAYIAPNNLTNFAPPRRQPNNNFVVPQKPAPQRKNPQEDQMGTSSVSSMQLRSSVENDGDAGNTATAHLHHIQPQNPFFIPEVGMQPYYFSDQSSNF